MSTDYIVNKGARVAPQLRAGLRLAVSPALGYQNAPEAGGQSFGPLTPNTYAGRPLTQGSSKGRAVFRCVDESNAFIATPAWASPGIPLIDAGKDFTLFGYWPAIRNPFLNNPALFRNGTTFCIFNGTTRRPWIRINGTDITGTPTGDQITAGQELSVVFRVTSAADWKVYANGKLSWSGTHAIATAAVSALEINTHSGAESFGNLAWAAGWARALPEAECFQLSRRPESLWQRDRPRIYSLPSAGVSFKPAWARNSNVILQPGAL